MRIGGGQQGGEGGGTMRMGGGIRLRGGGGGDKGLRHAGQLFAALFLGVRGDLPGNPLGNVRWTCACLWSMSVIVQEGPGATTPTVPFSELWEVYSPEPKEVHSPSSPRFW